MLGTANNRLTQHSAAKNDELRRELEKLRQKYRTVQDKFEWLRENAEKLKKQDAQLKASNDIFDRELQHLSTDNEVLTKSVGGLQQRVADILHHIRSVKLQLEQLLCK